MKKILSIILILISLQGISQTTKIFNTIYPNGLFGRKDTETITPLHNVINEYLTSFGTWGKLPDSTIKLITATSPIFYNNSTYVISSQQFTSTLNGYVPLSGGGTSNFLRADGSWATPAGTGTVTSIATTSPITGGTITSTGTIACATCVVAPVNPVLGVAHFAGSTQTATSSLIVNADITNSTIDLTTKVTGFLPVGNIVTATNADNTHFLRGDGTWQVPSGGAAGWLLAGNTGATNILGLTSNNALNFYTNNLRKAWIDSTTYRTFIDSIPISRGGYTSIGQNITNIGMGDSALYNNTTGTGNVGLGYQVLARSITAVGNTAVGYRALRSTTGGSNTGVGNQALQANLGGTDNVGVGGNALVLNTSGIRNTGIGSQALASVVGGAYNTGVGYNALTNNTGNYNTAVGMAALSATAGAQGNTSVGALSLTAATGADNAALGVSAGTAISTGTANTLIGAGSGQQLPSSSTANTFVGAESSANKGITSASSGNTIIGANYVSPVTTLTNTVILTAGGSGVAYPRFYSNSNMQTGIRYTSPSAVLQLAAGTPNFGKAPLKFTYWNLTTTAASGTGATVTLTFAAQLYIPFTIGDSIVVAGVTPSGYNGTFKVTGSTTTTVSYANGTSGAQTVAGTIKIGDQILAIPEPGAYEFDGTDWYGTAQGTRQTIIKGLKGSFSQVGTATTVFTVTFGGTQPNATYNVQVTPTAALSAALFYVTNKTTTTFDVTFLAGLTGTVTFDWLLTQ